MNAFHLVVSSPDGALFDGEAVRLSVRGADGDLAVMAGHIPFATLVKPCECRIELADGSCRTGHMEGGLLSVSSHETILLSDSLRWQSRPMA